jgi:hydrogenase expression/formation protein HypC
MRVTEKDKDTAIVESNGLRRNINISLLKNVEIGNYVIVHAGFAIEKLDQKKAEDSLSLFRQMRP